LFVYLI